MRFITHDSNKMVVDICINMGASNSTNECGVTALGVKTVRMGPTKYGHTQCICYDNGNYTDGMNC